jgi:hypothetical protein
MTDLDGLLAAAHNQRREWVQNSIVVTKPADQS